MNINVNSSPESATISDAARRYRPGASLERLFYASPQVYERDLQRVWCENWIWAGHASQVEGPGDYVRFDFGAESVIVVRDLDGQLHAHLNVCRHRGSRVCLESGGNARLFSCPYHGWTYNLDGSLRRARAMHREFNVADYGLDSIRIEVLDGLIFICLAHEPPPLAEALHALRPHVAPFELEKLKVAHSETYPVRANWKLALENYLECYHCARAHREYSRSHSLKDPDSMTPELVGAMEARAQRAGIITEQLDATGLNSVRPGCDAYYRRYPLYEGYDTGSQNGEGVAPLLGTLKDYDGGASDLQVGPFNHFLIYADHVVGYRFLPRDTQQTDIQTVWMVRSDALEGRDYDLDRLTWLWHETTLDDERIIRHNQEGVNSLRYRPGPLAPMEWGISGFLSWYTEAIR